MAGTSPVFAAQSRQKKPPAKKKSAAGKKAPTQKDEKGKASAQKNAAPKAQQSDQPPARQPRPRPRPRAASSTRRPPSVQAPRPVTLNSREIRKLSGDITRLSDEILALNKRTTKRFARLDEKETVPVNQRYRFDADQRQMSLLGKVYGRNPRDVPTLVSMATIARRNGRLDEAIREGHEGLRV